MSEHINKVRLAEIISQKSNITKGQAELAIDTLIQTITDTIKSGDEVSITGFGTFSAKKRAGRTGVNPRHPEQKIEIPPVLVAKFKAGKALKDTLKGKGHAPEAAPAVAAAPEPPVEPESEPVADTETATAEEESKQTE